MKKLNKIFALTLLSAAVVAGCSSDDDDEEMETGTATAGTATAGTATAGTATAGTSTTGGEDGGTGTATAGTDTAGTATAGTSTAGTATAGDGGEDGGMPPAAEAATLPAGTDYDPTAQDPEATLTLAEVAGAAGLTSLVGAAGDCPELNAALANADARLTVFAPNDDAFASEEVTAALAAPDADACAVLAGHVVMDSVASAADLGGDNVGKTVTTMGGTMITIGAGADAGTLTVNGANIISADNFATNGVAHVIDTVLLPMAEGGADGEDGGGEDAGGEDDGMATGGTPTGTGGANEAALSGDAAYTSFTQAFRDSLGGPSLDDPGNTWTVFAPNNDNFDAATFDVQNHVVVGTAYTAETLVGAGTITTNGGADYVVTEADGVVMVNGAAATVLSAEGTSVIFGLDGQL